MRQPGVNGLLLHTVAPAKVNWTLEVLGRRDDGYHEVRSLLQTVSLRDYLQLRPAREYSLAVEGGDTELRSEENLVTRAVASFPDQLRNAPVAFSVRKNIPMAAGLGGGSSNAAAALRLLDRYWRIHDLDLLAECAARLGSDVPFFLAGGLQLAAGRGEVLTPLPFTPIARLILASPPIDLVDKTPRLYAALRQEHYSSGKTTERLALRLAGGHRPTADDYVNVFDGVADRVIPRLAEFRSRFEQATGLRALLAGAGPTLFGVCNSSMGTPAIDQSVERLRQMGFRAWLVKPIGSASATHVQ